MAQSMWRDGDLNIFNNHQQGDYYEYSSIALAPHYLQPGIDGGIYSVHPVLMPVLMAPVYAGGGYPAVAAALVLIASLAATLAWRWVRRTIDAAGPATFAWAAIAGSSPLPPQHLHGLSGNLRGTGSDWSPSFLPCRRSPIDPAWLAISPSDWPAPRCRG